MSLRLEMLARLTPGQSERVRHLIESSPGAADSPPLSESSVLRLDSGGKHFLAFDEDLVVGYAQLDPGSGAVELVTIASPDAFAVAKALVAEAARHWSGASLSLWAHGRLSVAEALAHSEGWQPTRELLQMRRALDGVEAVTLPDDSDIAIRTFRPGVDEAAWLELNAIAFAHHPEQGSWSAADLADRLRSSWFDPAGFFLAERTNQAGRTGKLVGFHWTKVHRELSPPVGEVYVLGVHPSAQGLHLGQALLSAGLSHLRRQGLQTVLLYVEGDNVPAVRLYEKQGFSTFSVDIQYCAASS